MCVHSTHSHGAPTRHTKARTRRCCTATPRRPVPLHRSFAPHRTTYPKPARGSRSLCSRSPSRLDPPRRRLYLLSHQWIPVASSSSPPSVSLSDVRRATALLPSRPRAAHLPFDRHQAPRRRRTPHGAAAPDGLASSSNIIILSWVPSPPILVTLSLPSLTPPPSHLRSFGTSSPRLLLALLQSLTGRRPHPLHAIPILCTRRGLYPHRGTDGREKKEPTGLAVPLFRGARSSQPQVPAAGRQTAQAIGHPLLPPPKPITRLISHVILDLDGTLLNTDCVVSQVLKPFLVKNGKKWDSKKAHKFVGKTPSEAAAVVLEDYGLPYSTEEFLSMINPMFSEQWGNIKALPGANRLIKHLKSNRLPTAVASNSSRSNIDSKISCHQGWKEYFSAIVGADEVEKGKPFPDIFLEAAKRMNADPSNCLVIEDSLPGVSAGKAAGMHVIAVPSVPKKTDEFSSADEIINSLLDLRPEKWGLPPFNDWIEGTLPIEPWFIGGPVIKGFGRGSKVLGIPTANLPAENFSDILSEHTSGVYFGWAGLSTRGVYKMVMSIGWNPYFDNTEKTIEPWLLHGFDEDFYGEELRLAIVGYIRPEANFPSLESLIERIHEDGRIAENALDLPEYVKYKDSPYLRNPLQQGANSNRNAAEQEELK